ncbi:EscU/YscU/HrcU family type III secretion system export apparatus switch protein [Campylobacter sp. 19-13652]|uniref:EscU/YscU/HrcU family type III secretion system export apparatus switch protein n=1 Tax=Campylobacter sp. 19-13652 TaxID=2840180 RepID=UPI001C74BF80|nr:EscU/YscU/HrcU family type III secretion system export apparatus switch protein [Campylobacter sp. 19-13652]BCX79113.1 hypothetical protein LBC_05750 [Campylobacter sp. 19-13652]
MAKIGRKKAVALGFKQGRDNAPKVLASGEECTAERIIDLAQKNGIPVREDADLVEVLSKVEINDEIPPNLYKAVAEVFSFLYSITKK